MTPRDDHGECADQWFSVVIPKHSSSLCNIPVSLRQFCVYDGTCIMAFEVISIYRNVSHKSCIIIRSDVRYVEGARRRLNGRFQRGKWLERIIVESKIITNFQWSSLNLFYPSGIFLSYLKRLFVHPTKRFWGFDCWSDLNHALNQLIAFEQAASTKWDRHPLQNWKGLQKASIHSSGL